MNKSGGINNSIVLQPGDIWYVDNSKIQLDKERVIPIVSRPCLILATITALEELLEIVNIVPLSTKATADKFRFPIQKKDLYNSSSDFTPKNTFALIHLYQAISRSHLVNKVARIEPNAYLAIRYTLGLEVMGLTDEDFQF